MRASFHLPISLKKQCPQNPSRNSYGAFPWRESHLLSMAESKWSSDWTVELKAQPVTCTVETEWNKPVLQDLANKWTAKIVLIVLNCRQMHRDVDNSGPKCKKEKEKL